MPSLRRKLVLRDFMVWAVRRRRLRAVSIQCLLVGAHLGVAWMQDRKSPERDVMGNTEYAGLICDFCSDPKVVKDYPAISFALDSCPILGSEAGWAACQICADLIDADDWDGLTRRTTATFEVIVGGPLPAEMRESFAQQFTLLHRQFRQSRIRIRKDVS